MAKVTINAAPVSKTLDKKDKSGTYTKITQSSTFETRVMKMPLELDVENDSGYPIGEYELDVESQLKVGRYGLELPRYWKLQAISKKAAA